MPLVSEVLVVLGAGALVFLIAQRLGVGDHRAFGAVALVPIAAAVLFAAPAFADAITDLLDRQEENAPLTGGEAQLRPGSEIGIAVDFFTWASDRFGPEDTFHLEIGTIPDEAYVAGVGVRQAAILQWGVFQLAPNLAFEQSPAARDLEPGEGRNADWLVFYESDPADYPAGPLAEVATYAPGFAIARTGAAR